MSQVKGASQLDEKEIERTKQERTKQIKDSWNIIHENYIKEMMPVWKNKFETILVEREKQYDEFFLGRDQILKEL